MLTRLEVVHVLRRNLSNLEQTHRAIVLNESTALSNKLHLGRPNNAGEIYLYVPFGLVGDFHQEILASIHHMLQNLLVRSNV
jgi:hypothetical protein